MNAPNSSSNALSVRETTGLVEGNGVFVSSGIEQISNLFVRLGVPVRNGFGILKNYRPLNYGRTAEMLPAAGPSPIKRAGSCRRIGNHFSKRSTNGREVFFSSGDRPVTTRR